MEDARIALRNAEIACDTHGAQNANRGIVGRIIGGNAGNGKIA